MVQENNAALRSSQKITLFPTSQTEKSAKISDRNSLQYEWLPTRKEISASTYKGNLLFAGANFQE